MGQAWSWITSNLAEDERQGEARQENLTESLWGMVYTFVPVVIVALICLVIFFATRRSQRRFYAPRTYLGSLPEHERTPKLPDTRFSWIRTFWSIPDAYAPQHQSLDAYLFLRYLRVCTFICVVSMLTTWPILLPLHATGGNRRTQLEAISYSNIDIERQKTRLYAHALLAWLVYGFVVYVITRECIFYVNLRQAFLLTPRAAGQLSSRTVLFMGVPHEYLDERRLRKILRGAGQGEDSVRNIWINGDVKELSALVARRDEVCMMLERAEVRLIRDANKRRIKHRKASLSHHRRTSHGIPPDVEDGENRSAFRRVDVKHRPSHRLGFLGLFGQKVDTIDWCRRELLTLIPEAEQAQRRWRAGDFRKTGAVFVEFCTQHQAQVAYQVLTHHHSLSMAPKHIGVRPQDVIWRNLAVPWWQIIVRQYAMYAAVAALIIFWAIPVGVVGIVAQISVLQSLPFLRWLNQIPSSILGIIGGLLPSAVLSMVMSLVPGIMQRAARFAGAASEAEVELFTQNAFFLFQLVQVFLIRTITDTASSAIVRIAKSPTLIFSTLAEALPTSSNFYISYFIIEGISIAIDVMTQCVGCVIFALAYRFLAREPRAMYKRWTTLGSISWGSTMPVHTGIVVISITYAVIAPILLFWSSLGIGIFYQAYRYNILFVSDTQIDTRGLIYPQAMRQLFAGVYLAEICLTGMFFISKAFGQAALIIILLVCTVLYHITLSRALSPLLHNLPATLQVEEAMHQESLDCAPSNTNVTEKMSAGDDDDITVRCSIDQNGTRTESKVINSGVQATSSFPNRKEIRFNRQGNFLLQFLKPWVYADYWTLRKLYPHEVDFSTPQHEEVTSSSSSSSTEEESSRAQRRNCPYWPACVTSPTPLLWVPRDEGGFSDLEVAETRMVIGITNEGCTLDEKNKIQWDREAARPPIWEEKTYY